MFLSPWPRRPALVWSAFLRELMKPGSRDARSGGGIRDPLRGQSLRGSHLPVISNKGPWLAGDQGGGRPHLCLQRGPRYLLLRLLLLDEMGVGELELPVQAAVFIRGPSAPLLAAAVSQQCLRAGNKQLPSLNQGSRPSALATSFPGPGDRVVEAGAPVVRLKECQEGHSVSTSPLGLTNGLCPIKMQINANFKSTRTHRYIQSRRA